MDAITQQILQDRQAARAVSLPEPEDDPERAAKAIQLGRDTGVSPTAIYNDQETFERNHRVALIQELIHKNPHLADYATSHPLAPKVSADDWGNLDKLSQTLEPWVFNRATYQARAPQGAPEPFDIHAANVLGAAASGFAEGFGHLRAPWEPADWIDLAQAKDYPLLQAPIFNGYNAIQLASIGGWGIEAGSHFISGLIHAVGKAVPAGLVSQGMDPSQADRWGREVAGQLERYFIETGAKGHIGPEAVGRPEIVREAEAQQTAIQSLKVLDRYHKALNDTALWLRAGREPPPGIAKEIDDAKAEQARTDLKNLDETVAAAKGTATAARSPEMLERFLRQKAEGTISIPAEAVRKLYGDAEPAPKDGILGWVPGLADELRVASESGGDVHIPIVDWIVAQATEAMKPEVADALHDDIRARPGGVTLNEVEGLKEFHSFREAQLASETKPMGVGAIPFPPVSLRDIPETGGQQAFIIGRDATIHDVGDAEGGHLRAIGKMADAEGVELETITEGGKPIPGKPYVNEYMHQHGMIGVTRYGDSLGFNVVEGLSRRQYSVIAEMARKLGDPEKTLFTIEDRNGKELFYSTDVKKLARFVDDPANRAVQTQAGLTPARRAWFQNIPEEHEVGGEVTHSGVTVPRVMGMKLGDLLDQLHFNFLNPHDRVLSEALTKQLRDEVGDTPVHIVSQENLTKLIERDHPEIGKNTPGFHSVEEGHIVLREGMVNGTEPPWVTSQIVLHEAEHAFSSKALFQFPGLDKMVQQLMDHMKNNLSDKLMGNPQVAYAFKDTHEFLAQAKSVSDVRNLMSVIEAPKEVVEPLNKLAADLGIAQRVHNILDALKMIVRDLYRRFTGALPEESVLDQIFKLNETIERANRVLELMDKGDTQLAAIEKARTEFGPEIKPEDIAESAKAVGMEQDRFMRYLRAINKQISADEAKQVAEASKDIRRRQTKEWKENESRISREVRTDFEQRPDVQTHRLLSEQRIGDTKLGEKIKLDASKLTPDQKELLPKDFYGRDGTDPEMIAGLFGYGSAEAMVNRLAMYDQAVRSSKLTPREYLDRIVADETERRMQKQYGDLEENVLREAQEHVVTDTAMDLLHEETVHYGLLAGSKLPLEKGDLAKWAKGEFQELKVGNLTADRFLDDAGRAGRAAELALLKGDATEAFRQKQAQYRSMLLAKEAKAFEKVQDRGQTLAQRYAKREVSGTPQEWTNWIHDIMLRVGLPVRRSIQDLQTEIAAGTHDSLAAFVDAKSFELFDENNPMAGFFRLPVPDFLLDPNFRKSLKDMTVKDYKAVVDGMSAMDKVGREVGKITVRGDKFELHQFIDEEILPQLERLPERLKQFDYTRKKGILRQGPRVFFWSHVNIESMFNRIDRGDPNGPLTQSVMLPLAKAANHEEALQKEFAAKLRGLLRLDNPDKIVDNTILKDPVTGEPAKLSRRNVLAIVQNLGNASNLDKFMRGFGIAEEERPAFMDWLYRNTTKEDWDRAQALGDLYSELKGQADDVYRNIYGIAPESVELQPLQTPYGTYRGWYHPVFYDPLRPGRSQKLLGTDVEGERTFLRPSTPAGYTRKRTGYAAPVVLDFDMVPNHMMGIIHDISFRSEVREAAKIFYDDAFRKAFIKHYGKVQSDMLVPYLRDVANVQNYMSQAAASGNRIVEFFRQNAIGTLIGLNPGTVMKHFTTALANSIGEVGTDFFSEAMTAMFRHSDEVADSNWRFAVDSSQELQRRHRNWNDTLYGAGVDLDLLPKNTYQSWRQALLKFGASPVAFSDMVSSVPMWLAAYKRSVSEGLEHGEAVAIADRAVRRQHGSSVITNRPEIMRTNAMGAMYTSLYGFFSHMLQRQYELMWKAKDSFEGIRAGDFEDWNQHKRSLLVGLLSYVIIPAVIEEIVTPIPDREKHSWGYKAAATLINGLSSSWIGVRDMVRGLFGGRDTGVVGLIPTTVQPVLKTIEDVSSSKPMDRARASRLIKDGTTAFGMLTGLTNAQMGRSAEYLQKVWTRQEHPRTIPSWLYGLWHGETKTMPNTAFQFATGQRKPMRR